MPRKPAESKIRHIGPPAPNRLLLRVTLRHTNPPIWREISVSDDFSLFQLHRVIQLVFGWLDYHLFHFEIGSRRFERVHPEAVGEDAGAAHLRDFKLKRGKSFVYIYDMGDYWEHDLLVTEIAPIPPNDMPSWIASLIGGARAAPPEDVGGPPGYEAALAALRRGANADKELVAWIGKDFNPELFDRRAVDHALVLASAWDALGSDTHHPSNRGG
jgi:hypothetical protein